MEVSTGVADGQAVLTVADTGMGIPAADLERIFERFYRTAAATRQVIPGTGLGLAIARAIADAHDGAITVESTDGRGSTFTVRLPLRPVPAAQADPLARRPAPGSNRPAGRAARSVPRRAAGRLPGQRHRRRRLIAGMTEVSSALATSAACRLACCFSARTAAAARRSLTLRDRLPDARLHRPVGRVKQHNRRDHTE